MILVKNEVNKIKISHLLTDERFFSILFIILQCHDNKDSSFFILQFFLCNQPLKRETWMITNVKHSEERFKGWSTRLW